MGSQVVSLGGTGWSPQWLCRCCSVVAWSGASKTSQLSIIFRLIWEQTDSSGSRLTLVSTGRRSSTRMVLRREPMAGSTPTMFSDCLTTLLMGLDTGLWRRVSSRLDHLNPELWSALEVETLSWDSRFILWMEEFRMVFQLQDCT